MIYFWKVIWLKKQKEGLNDLAQGLLSLVPLLRKFLRKVQKILYNEI